MKFTKGDIVVVTESYSKNHAKPGQVVKIYKTDNSDVPYCVEDFLKLYNWKFETNWCVGVREPTVSELVSVGLLDKELNYEIY